MLKPNPPPSPIIPRICNQSISRCLWDRKHYLFNQLYLLFGYSIQYPSQAQRHGIWPTKLVQRNFIISWHKWTPGNTSRSVYLQEKCLLLQLLLYQPVLNRNVLVLRWTPCGYKKCESTCDKDTHRLAWCPESATVWQMWERNSVSCFFLVLEISSVSTYPWTPSQMTGILIKWWSLPERQKKMLLENRDKSYWFEI